MKVSLQVLLGVVLAVILSDIVGAEDEVAVSATTQECQAERRPIDCEGVEKAAGEPLISGVYLIQPLGFTEPFNVYCDFEVDGGGWTVIQRRVDKSTDFNVTWSEYKDGFGRLVTNHWLGNDKISALTKQRGYQLRIELLGPTGYRGYAKYSSFLVDDEDHFYQLFLGDYTGTAGGDSFGFIRDLYFTTFDADHDENDNGNCAQVAGLGGWWYYACSSANLNAVYVPLPGTSYAIRWSDLPEGASPLKFTEMKIRAY